MGPKPHPPSYFRIFYIFNITTSFDRLRRLSYAFANHSTPSAFAIRSATHSILSEHHVTTPLKFPRIIPIVLRLQNTLRHLRRMTNASALSIMQITVFSFDTHSFLRRFHTSESLIKAFPMTLRYQFRHHSCPPLRQSRSDFHSSRYNYPSIFLYVDYRRDPSTHRFPSHLVSLRHAEFHMPVNKHFRSAYSLDCVHRYDLMISFTFLNIEPYISFTI